MKTNIVTGWVGFFDILGYKNLLIQNEPESIAEEVVPLLTGTKSEVVRDIKRLFELLSEKNKNIAEDFQSATTNLDGLIEELSLLLFSDTLLVTMPAGEEVDNDSAIRLAIFSMACKGLQYKLFRCGLPVRGAIDYGKFYVKDMCFAGRPFINAYELANRLELAACVLSDIASKQFRSISINAPEIDTFVAKYLVPMKDGEHHFQVMKTSISDIGIDIRQYVMKSFWSHRKDISVEVQTKVANTEQWLRFLVQLNKTESIQQGHAADVQQPAADG